MIKKSILSLILLIIVFSFSFQELAAAKPESAIMKVGISPFKPFVMIDDEKATGFAIDVWEKAVEELGLQYKFVISRGVSDKLALLASGDIDVAIGGITVTQKREEKVDFCHPYFHTGLDILVPANTSVSFADLVVSFFTRSKLIIIGLFVFMLITFGHLIWLVERRNPKDKRLFRKKYLNGILEGMYWAIVTASTVGYGDKVPRTALGRFLTCFVIIASLPLFAFFIAELSSNITLNRIRAHIEGPADLPGRRVGVVKGTTSEEWIESVLADVHLYEVIDEAYYALQAGLIEAVVYDQANLLYFSTHEGKGRYSVVGRPFAYQEYGWALPQIPESVHRRELLNRALLAIQESGELDRIHFKWFGKRP
jgi:ABC-type amino acid transport substrate-binding protein